MTLIITSISKDRVVQVSDRRLTTPMGDIYDDSANKAIAVGMGYVHFVASYTGLAYIGHLTDENRTDRWLQYHLGSITRSGELSLEKHLRGPEPAGDRHHVSAPSGAAAQGTQSRLGGL